MPRTFRLCAEREGQKTGMENFSETAVFVKDADGVMVYANDTFARLLRRSGADELVGKRSADFFPAEAAAMLRQEDADVFAKGEPYRIERKLVCTDGQSRVFAFRKIPVAFGERKYLFCFAEVAQPKATAPSDTLPVSSDARARFFSAVSHDVRTPLNAIVGYAQLLLNAQGPDQSREAARAIDAGARNLLTAIDGVMTLLSPESALKEEAVETFNVSDATLHVVESYSEAAGENNVELLITSGQLPLVEFAGAAYKDVLGRLLENAVRSTPSGYVEVRTSFADGDLTLQVKDMSPGMTPGEIAEVMDPNAEKDPNACPGSSTLSLVVVKRIVERLNGTFAIRSAVKAGTTVSVVFHGVKATDGKKRAVFIQTQKLRTMRIEDPFRFEKRILVVDDHHLNVRILSLLLNALGFRNVATATSGEKALELLRQSKFDIVFTDLMMPGMDGRRLLREIRKIPGLDLMPVYAVTADACAPVTCAQDGFKDILLKPITKEMLKEAL